MNHRAPLADSPERASSFSTAVLRTRICPSMEGLPPSLPLSCSHLKVSPQDCLSSLPNCAKSQLRAFVPGLLVTLAQLDPLGQYFLVQRRIIISVSPASRVSFRAGLVTAAFGPTAPTPNSLKATCLGAVWPPIRPSTYLRSSPSPMTSSGLHKRTLQYRSFGAMSRRLSRSLPS